MVEYLPVQSVDGDTVNQPVWTQNIEHNDATNEMYLSLYSKENPPYSFLQEGDPIIVPEKHWVHIEAYYKASSGRTGDGEIKIWQDGELILSAENVITTLESEIVFWGIGNYTDHIDGGEEPGSATIYFDDCIISTLAVHQYIATGISPGIIGNDPDNNKNMFLFPNPTSTTIELNFNPVHPIQIIDAYGRIHKNEEVVRKIDISSIPPGIYILRHGKDCFGFSII